MPSQRSWPPFRAEHIGSFARPDILLHKRTEFDQQKCSREELIQCEDAATAGIIEVQKEVGLKTITDGEFRRYVAFESMQCGTFRLPFDTELIL